jgi:hypothetical protein
MLCYRWCQVPCIPELLEVTELDIPELLNILADKIQEFFGLSCIPSVVANNASTIYDENNRPVDYRYLFNREPEDICESERRFYLTFTLMEEIAYPLMVEISNYLKKKNSKSLIKIKELFSEFHGIYSARINNKFIPHTHFTQSFQFLQSWGINGRGGTSGSQSYPMMLFDAFIGTEKGGIISTNAIDLKSRLLKQDREVIYSLEKNLEGRFDGFEKEYEDLKNEILSFRCNHKHRSINYLKRGKVFRTAAMNSEFKSGDFHNTSEKLIDGIKVILDERLDETKRAKVKRKKTNNISILLYLTVIFFTMIFILSCLL